MRQRGWNRVLLIYISTAVIVLTFLPGTLNMFKGASHVLEHLLLLFAAGVLTYSIERLRQRAHDKQISEGAARE